MLRALGKLLKWISVALGTLLATGLAAACLFGARCYRYVTEDVMTSGEVKIDLGAMPVNLTSTIYYRDPDTGEYVEWVELDNAENRVWVDESDIPVQVENAFVAIEDQRFWTHRGVDMKRTLGAAVSAVTGKNIYGGSTITQQLVKNLTGDREVTVRRKLIEMCRALKLEETYSKSEILEWYMNVIFFGRGQYGVGTAARYYFGKELDELTLGEICSIVSITNNPSLYDPYSFPENNLARRDLVLDKMLELGYITESDCAAAKAETLCLAEHSGAEDTGTEVYPYYVDAVIDDVIDWFQENMGVTGEQASAMLFYGGYDIYACVDMRVQSILDDYYADPDNIPKTQDGKDLQSAMVIMDPYTGDIAGLIGGVGEKTVARGLNWATGSLGRRPPGSAIKPVSTYAPAIEAGLITPDTLFLDAADVKLSGTDWFPKNDSGKNYGVVTVRYGLVRSLNTVAAQVMDALTPDASYVFLTETLGMDLEPEDRDYAPLAAGQLTVGTTVREMATAYTIFPNMGVCTQGRTFSQIYTSEGVPVCSNAPEAVRAVSEKTAYWMTDMLSDAVAYGTGTEARLSNMPSAGKTGTTTGNRDRWFVGYTPYYVGAVWTGYAQPARIRVSGNPAAQIWHDVMTAVHEGLERREFTVPEDVSLPRVPGSIPAAGDEPEDTSEVPGEETGGEDGEALPEDPGDVQEEETEAGSETAPEEPKEAEEAAPDQLPTLIIETGPAGDDPGAELPEDAGDGEEPPSWLGEWEG